MNTNRISMVCSLALAAAFAACGGTEADGLGGLDEDVAATRGAAIGASAKKVVCDVIKSVGESRGITNGLVLAGIANHEGAGLNQCKKDLSWACSGPPSSYCGGPVMTGSADGIPGDPCYGSQGGIGIFQLDAGTHSQTIAAWGADVVDLTGNAHAGISHMLADVRRWFGYTTDQQAANWINTATPGTAAYGTFMQIMAAYYNGCGCTSARDAYRSATDSLYTQFGSDYWYGDRVHGGRMRVARDGNNRLTVVVVGVARDLYYRVQTAAGASTFTAWTSLGGKAGSDPVLVTANGRVTVIVKDTSDRLVYKTQGCLGGCWPATWTSLGGPFTTEPAAGVSSDGRIHLWARSDTGALKYLAQSSAGGAFPTSWTDLGGVLESAPAAIQNSDGRWEVFARGVDATWHLWQTSPGGAWSAWASMGSGHTSDPAVARNSDGRLQVFIRGNDGALKTAAQTTAGGTFGAFTSAGGWLSAAPVAARNADGRLEVYVRGDDRRLWRLTQTTPGGALGAFTNLGSNFLGASALAAGTNSDGRIELFVRGDNGALWRAAQGCASGCWSGFTTLDGVMLSF